MRKLLATLMLAGAAAAPGHAIGAEPLAVVATVGMLGDVAGEVGGSCVDVAVMMGPGTDPHLYQPTASDVRGLQGAELILFVGLSLEGQLGEVLDRFGERTPTLAVGEAVAGDALIEAEGGGVDPHLWMDPELWSRTAGTIAEEVAALRPECAEELRANAAAYAEALTALDGWIAESVATIPERQRVLVTAHDAFAYFARAYGIEVLAVQGISTEAEASVADIRATAEALVEAEVPSVFVETTINPRTVEALVEAAADRGHQVEVGGTLYSDALGEAGTPEGTYIGMLVANTRAIVEGLGGTPAPLPPGLDAWAAEWDAG